MDRRSIASSVFEDGWNRRQFDALSGVLAEFRFHISGDTRTMDFEEFRTIVDAWHAAFEHLRFDLRATIETEPFAAVHATLRGIHRGPWQGIAPTGRAIDVDHMFLFRFDGDAIVDVWEFHDPSQLRNQLG